MLKHGYYLSMLPESVPAIVVIAGIGILCFCRFCLLFVFILFLLFLFFIFIEFQSVIFVDCLHIEFALWQQINNIFIESTLNHVKTVILNVILFCLM